jgi:DNA invertase Pin-like site-specific DNA recombinase
MSGHLYGYARVSTADQDPELQTAALELAGCVRVFVDKASGKLDRRPQLEALRETLLAGDTLVVWKLDRLGRRTAALLALVEELAGAGVGFRSLTEPVIDTTSPQGRLLLAVFAAFAELERDMNAERTRAGLAVAAARGRHVGRPPALTDDQVRDARQMYDAGGRTIGQIAGLFDVSRRTIYRALSENRCASNVP